MIDLFSDTHTLPDEGMRRAIAEAEVGDDQLGEDPTTKRLEEHIAQMLGTEAAVFMITGAMCNKVAVAAMTRPGDSLVCDHLSHVFRFEGGGPAVLSGILFEPIVTERGIFTPEQLEAVLNPGSVYQSRTSLVCLEQTHNFAGGTVWPLADYEAACRVAHDAGALVYTDGARLFNAVVATGVPAERWAAQVDAIWVDFSKAVGAPGGAALAGSAELIAAATRFKYLIGGAMRQSGFLAAAALYGLEHNLPRVPDDHRRAQRLAAGLADIGLAITPPESNMVFANTPAGFDLDGFIAALDDEGVRVSKAAGRVRMVTHLGVSDADIEEAIAAGTRVLSKS